MSYQASVSGPPTLSAKYAVFLPVRNGASYIRQAIDSVVNQTNGDWILIVLDNASSDGSGRIAAEYDHPSIHVYESDVPLSIYDSWRRIWSILRDGHIQVQYATTIGHDDCLLPSFFSAVDGLIASSPDASLYQVGFTYVDERSNVIRPCRPFPVVESGLDMTMARLWGLRDSVGTGYVFRPSDYVAVGGIPDLPSLLYADDILFGKLANLSFKAAVRDSHCLYRLHRGSASHAMTVERIEGQVLAAEMYLNELCNEFPELFQDRAGAAAVACFIARDVLILRHAVIERLLGSETVARVSRLESEYRKLAGPVRLTDWFGTNVVSRDIYIHLKRCMIALALAKARLRATLKSLVP